MCHRAAVQHGACSAVSRSACWFWSLQRLVGIEVKALRFGQSAEPALQEQVLHFLIEREEVAQVLNLITLQDAPMSSWPCRRA